MEEGIKLQAFKGVFWSAIDKVGFQIISIIVTILLARMLTPNDYGIVGMLTIFIALGNLLVDSGMTQALIQRPKITDNDISTVFFYNLFISLLCYLVLYLFAPEIAKFFAYPILIPVTRVMGLILIINSLGTIQITLLQRKIDFKSYSIINIISSILSGTFAVILALNDYGVWSLVYYNLSNAAIKTVLLWVFSKWYPSIIFSLGSLKILFSYGSNLLFAGFLGIISNNLINLVIGKVYTSSALGFYSQARRMMEIPSTNIIQTIQNVSFPLLSKLQHDDQLLKRSYKRIYILSAFVLLPIMMGMMVLSEYIVKFLLGDQWLPSVPLLQWLCVFGILNPLSSINVNILKVKAKTNIYLKLSFFNQILQVVILYFTFRHGIEVMTMGIALYSVIFFLRNAYISGRVISYSVIEQLSDIKKVFFISLAMTASLWIITNLYALKNIWELLIIVFLGICVYGSLSFQFLKPLILDVRDFIKTPNIR